MAGNESFALKGHPWREDVLGCPPQEPVTGRGTSGPAAAGRSETVCKSSASSTRRSCCGWGPPAVRTCLAQVRGNNAAGPFWERSFRARADRGPEPVLVLPRNFRLANQVDSANLT